MPLTDDDAAKVARAVLNQTLGRSTVTVGQVLQGLPAALAVEGTNPTELTAALAALPKPAPADEQAIVAGVLAGLSPQAIVAAIPPELARQVADELAARLTS